MKVTAITTPHSGSRISRAFSTPGSASIPDFSRFTGIDRLFDVLLDGLSLHNVNPNTQNKGMLRPPLDIRSEDKQYVVALEIPGIDEKDITVEINDNELSIKGEKNNECRGSADDSDTSGFYTERVYGCFARTLSLPDDVDEAAVRADHKNGVLTITLPRKVQEKTVRSIAVNKK